MRRALGFVFVAAMSCLKLSSEGSRVGAFLASIRRQDTIVFGRVLFLPQAVTIRFGPTCRCHQHGRMRGYCDFLLKTLPLVSILLPRGHCAQCRACQSTSLHAAWS